MKNNFTYNSDGTTTIYIKYHGRTVESLISTAKFDLADAFPNTWFAAWDSVSRTYYVYGKITINGKVEKLYLHREVMQCPDGQQVHHRNHNGLDNRNENLDNVTPGEHAKKGRPKDKPILGDLNGVTNIHILEKAEQDENGGYKCLDVEVNGIYFGSYSCIEEANLRYNIAYAVMNEGLNNEKLLEVLVGRFGHDREYIKLLIVEIRKYIRVPNSINEQHRYKKGLPIRQSPFYCI